jgi:hypothetical protein
MRFADISESLAIPGLLPACACAAARIAKIPCIPLDNRESAVENGSPVTACGRISKTHERFVKAARLILLLPAGDWFERFHTA